MMTSRTDRDIETTDGGSGLDRRQFIQRAGVGAAVAGGAWAAPSIVGSSVAFAAGSETGPTVPTTTDPANLLCGTIAWPKTNDTPGHPAFLPAYPLTSPEEPSVQLISVTSALAGPTPPTIASNYRNLGGGYRPYSGEGSISGITTVPGLMLVQNNAGLTGSNASPSTINNYQELTFTFSTPIYNLRFTIRDLTANTNYWDAVGFDQATTVTGDTFTSGHLAGTGTFTDPFRRTTTDDYFWGLAQANHTIPLDLSIAMPGPVTTFKMRYASIGGKSIQWISLGPLAFGNCPA